MRMLRFSLTVFTALTLCHVVLAQEGPIVINQDRVSAGNITPGDLPGYPVTITQSGSYILTGNLVNMTVNRSIEIAASDVSLDLNGFLVQCRFINQTVGTHECIYAGPNTSRIAIRNGSVAMTGAPASISGGSQIVVNLPFTSMATLEGLKISGGGSSFYMGPFTRIGKVTVSSTPVLTCPSLVLDSVNAAGDVFWLELGCATFNSLGRWPNN